MSDLYSFKTIPIGSIISRPSDKISPVLEKVVTLETGLKNMISAESTGAYLRGLTKNSNISTTETPKIAFAVLQVAIGEVALAQLANLLVKELKIDQDNAQRIAKDIEKELFSTLLLELNNPSKKQSNKTSPASPTLNPNNILNLKSGSQKSPPPPPMLPN